MIFTCNSFTGHWTTRKTAAVVEAGSRIDAARKLNIALKLRGLEGDARVENMIRFEGEVSILSDGTY